MTAPGNPFAGQERVEGSVPMLRHLKDHLIIVIPRAHKPIVQERNKFDKAGGFQDKLIADVIVCDGPAIMFGGVWNQTPDTIQLQAPCLIPEMWVYQGPVIDFVMSAAVKGVPLGRVRLQASKSGGNPYYVLEAAHDNPQDVSLAMARYQEFQAGQLFRFTPVQPLVTAPSPAAPMGGYAAPVNPVTPQWPTAQPVATAAPAWPGVAPVAPAPMVTDWTLLAMPANFPPGPQAWAAATVQDRTQFLAQQGTTGPQNMQPTGL